MSKDLGPILGDWPHEPGQITVRKIRGTDGRVKIQLRVDLGLLQMEADGRPDGSTGVNASTGGGNCARKASR